MKSNRKLLLRETAAKDVESLSKPSVFITVLAVMNTFSYKLLQMDGKGSLGQNLSENY